MENTSQSRRKYSDEELKELFSADYQFPSDEEFERTPMVTLEEILSELENKYPSLKTE